MIEFLILIVCCVISFFVGQWAGAHPADASGAVTGIWAKLRNLFKREKT